MENYKFGKVVTG